jgi:hypothetical protein
MARPPFDRERFLLYCVGFILLVQFGIFVIAAGICSVGFYKKLQLLSSAHEEVPICPKVLESLHDSVAQASGILLALLGGGAVATNEIQRRRKPPTDDGDDGRGEM